MKIEDVKPFLGYMVEITINCTPDKYLFFVGDIHNGAIWGPFQAIDDKDDFMPTMAGHESIYDIISMKYTLEEFTFPFIHNTCLGI